MFVCHCRPLCHRGPATDIGSGSGSEGDILSGRRPPGLQVQFRQGQPQFRRFLSRRRHGGRSVHPGRSARTLRYSRHHGYPFTGTGRACGGGRGYVADTGLPLSPDRSTAGRCRYGQAGEYQKRAVPFALGDAPCAGQGPQHGQ